MLFPDSSIAKDFKCSRTKETDVLKVIARIVEKPFPQQLERLNTSASKLMRQLILSLHNKLLLFFDNTQGQVRCVFFNLESVGRATAELPFNVIDKHFQESTILLYDNLVRLGTDGANVMLGARNSVVTDTM